MASQWGSPGALLNCATVETANTMSGWVPTARCMSDLTVARYGTLFMHPISLAGCGDWSCKSFRPGSIGTGAGLQVARLYLVRMASIYACCNNDMVRCHAPNTFGTVNMEHTIDSSLSWSER